jgi:ABC-type oligopeptide transport system substrate-binding subunit
MGHKVSLWLLAFGLTVALLVSAASASPNSESRRGGTLRLLWGAEPDSLDPALAEGNIGSWSLLSLTCAKLFTTVHDPDSGQARVVPEVVLTYSTSNDGRTYTFELKQTFRFNTRAPVTAQSFVDAFNRDALMRVIRGDGTIERSPVVSGGFIQDIIGADAVIRGQSKRISGVQALGRYRLRIRLKRQVGDLVARLTMPYFCPIVPGTRMNEPPGAGPYYVADHVTNRRIVLERNPYYRGGRIANPDRILWTIEPDASARLRAIKQEQHDYVLLFNFPDTVVRDLVDEYGLNRRVFRFPPSFQETKFLFTFNQKRSAFKGAGQAPLRKAINYVIDRPELVRTHGFLAVRRSDRLLAAALSDSRRLYPLDGTNPVAAGRWLARAGHLPERLTLYTDSFPWNVKSAQVFIFNMRQLGIEVEPHYFDFLTLQEKLATPGEPWDVAGVGMHAVYPDPAGAFVPLLRGTRYEARVNAANRLRGADRAKAWADLETDLMRDDPPVATYGDWRPLFFVSRSFGCWQPGQELDFAAICKK